MFCLCATRSKLKPSLKKSRLLHTPSTLRSLLRSYAPGHFKKFRSLRLTLWIISGASASQLGMAASGDQFTLLSAIFFAQENVSINSTIDS